MFTNHRPTLIRPAECANRLGVHKSTITRWARIGLIPAWRMGGVVRFDWDEVVRALRQSRDVSEEPEASHVAR